MNRYILLAAILNYFVDSNGQNIYFSSHENLGSEHLITRIGKFDVLTCESVIIYADTLWPDTGYIEWLDIAICPDGSLYGLGHDGIYTIDTLTDSEIKIFEPPSSIRYWLKSIYCFKDTSLIFVERDVFHYYPLTNTYYHFGRLPNPKSIWSNIFLYNNQIMYSGGTEVQFLDTTDLAASGIYKVLDKDGLLSLTQMAVTCDSTATFAMFISGEVYLVDTTDWSLHFYCAIPSGPDQTFQGTEPDFMYMKPEPCSMEIDLDDFDITIPGIDFKDTIFCAASVPFLFTDIDFYSDKSWDSITVQIVGTNHGFSLLGTIPSFANLKGNRSNRLTYSSLGIADISSMAEVLNGLTLIGDFPKGITELKLTVVGNAKNLITDTAFIYLTLVGRTTTSGDDVTIIVCPADDRIDLHDFLSSGANPGGDWSPELKEPPAFIPGKDLAGSYFYIVDDPKCPPDSATFDIQFYKVQNVSLGADLKICHGETIILSVPIDAQIQWSDGSTGSTYTVKNPGEIFVEVTDANGCVERDTLSIFPDFQCIADSIYVPNIFSPNQDGNNDQIFFNSSALNLELELLVFDRWGNLLFYDKGFEIQWDGRTINGTIINPGVYAYRLVLHSPKGNIIRTGSITVLR